MKTEKKAMLIQDIKEAIRSLGASQGFYGRLYENIVNLEQEDPEEYDKLVEMLEDEEFNDILDLVLYFEEGVSNKEAKQAAKLKEAAEEGMSHEELEESRQKVKWVLPVTWEMCGVVEVEAATVEEAIAYFKRNERMIPLPERSEYVGGSFNLALEDENELKECIQSINR